MKFSIVTISYNQAEFLERTIQSVISQKGVELEYIIVDPGSTDGSREIIERYKSSFSHILLKKDNGPADGLNKGFALASGDWFGYINSDDYYLPDGLARVAAAAERWPDAGALVGDGYIVDQDDATIRRSFSKRVTVRSFQNECAFALQQATFYRAEAFRRVGAFKVANRTCWDSEILADMLLAGYKVRNIDKDIGAFRIHNLSITGSGRLTQQYLLDAGRIREKALGRKPGSFQTKIVQPCYKLSSYAVNPIRTGALVWDKLVRRFSSPR